MALETAGSDMKKRLAANKPIQTVLIRQRLGGVGNGSPTAPRPSEIDAVAAEEAERAAATAAVERAAAERAAAEKRAARVSAVAAEVLPVEVATEVEGEGQEAASAEEAVEEGVPPSYDGGGSSSSSGSALSGLSGRDMPTL